MYVPIRYFLKLGLSLMASGIPSEIGPFAGFTLQAKAGRQHSLKLDQLAERRNEHKVMAAVPAKVSFSLFRHYRSPIQRPEPKGNYHAGRSFKIWGATIRRISGRNLVAATPRNHEEPMAEPRMKSEVFLGVSECHLLSNGNQK
jgi:hypothetical protein